MESTDWNEIMCVLLHAVNFTPDLYPSAARVNLFSPDHISFLIHRTFNISIPRNHIPLDKYYFEDYVHFGTRAGSNNATSASQNEMDVDETPETIHGQFAIENTLEDAESLGKWLVVSNGERIGGEGGFVEFTIIG
jgi:DNA-directed RNA polymerase I subunit RPA43